MGKALRAMFAVGVGVGLLVAALVLGVILAWKLA